MDLKKLTELLMDKAATVESVSAQIGTVEDHQQGAGYDLRPADPRFTHAFLGVDEAANGESPRYVKLTLSPGTAMRLAELEGAFGQWRELSPRRDRPPPARFKYDRPDREFLGIVHAYGSAEPDDPTTTVQELTIRREERLS